MTTTSPRLGLIVPARTDPFSTTDIAANWGKIDTAFGQHADSLASMGGTVSGLQSQVDGKANIAHGHAEADVANLTNDINNLQGQISNRAVLGHTHAEAEVGSLPGDLANLQSQISNITWAGVKSKPINNIRGGFATITFSGGFATLAHGLGANPIAAAITSVSGGGTDTVVMLSGPSSWDGTNLKLRASIVSTSTNYSGPISFAWIAIS